MKPWARAPAYFIGAMTAIVHVENPDSVGRLGKSIGLATVVFMLSLILMAISIFGAMSAQYLPSPW